MQDKIQQVQRIMTLELGTITAAVGDIQQCSDKDKTYNSMQDHALTISQRQFHSLRRLNGPGLFI